MTTYFDDKVREVTSHDGDPQAVFDHVEAPMIREVSQATGDREFPDDLRERIQGIIATDSLADTEGRLIPRHALDMFRVSGHSTLVSTLHTAFHEVARRRVQTRFGVLLDDPAEIVRLRDEHD